MKTTGLQLPGSIQDDLASIGLHIEVARKRRKIPAKVVYEAAGITPQTYKRLVSGDPGVAIGTIAKVLHALNLEHTLMAIANPAQDEQGIALEVSRVKRSDKVYHHGKLDTNF